MINVTENDKKFIEKEIPNGVALLSSGDLEGLKDEFSEILGSAEGLGEDGWPTPYGEKVDDVYMRVLEMNR